MIFQQVNQLASTTRSNQHYQQPTSTNLWFWIQDWIQEMNQGLRGDGAGEDVDEDNPPQDGRVLNHDGGDNFPLTEGSIPGRTALSELQIGSAKVPPRGGGVSSRKLAHDFFQGKSLHIAEDCHRRAARGPMRQGACPGGRACPPPQWARCGPPGEVLVLIVFYIFVKHHP